MSGTIDVTLDGPSIELQRKIDEWLMWDRNEKTVAEINDLIVTNNYVRLSKILLERISFGTAGLRGKMSAGYACMNDLVIVQTGQGLLKHLEETNGQLLMENGIVIGYDGRHNSKRFSDLTAAIFLHKNVPVYIFSSVVPTPFVPFAVTKFKCVAGVMITASHNPKEDNGYKLYGSNGAQIVSPSDKNVQKHILANLQPLTTSWDVDVVGVSKKVHDPLAETLVNYMNVVNNDLLPDHKAINAKSELRFTYSAMHGVGYNYVAKACANAGIKIIPVVEQRDPDPEFPTVKFPNPEEGKSSLDLSFKTADANNSTIILANDPDADRLAIAEKDKSTGQWKVFTGNEIGAVLGWWSLHCYQKRYPNEPLSECYMLSSTVSSKILRTMAQAEGLNFIETLTGFKWMGNRSYDLIGSGKKVIFAFEEAIGFMYGSAVLDKDGVSAAVHLATLASYLNHHGISLTQQLAEIYQEYGNHLTCNSYFICYDGDIIRKIFDKLRTFAGAPNTYPKSLLNGKYQIKSVRDLTTGYDTAQPDNKATLPVSKSSQMITFEFTNGLVATLRTSGTEPKVKYYTELCTPPSQTNKMEIRDILEEMVDSLIDEFLQPKQNGLISRSS